MQPGGAAREPGPEPGRGLDPPDRHAERRGDLAVVGERAHGGAELRHAQEDRRSPAVMAIASPSEMICVRFMFVLKIW